MCSCIGNVERKLNDNVKLLKSVNAFLGVVLLLYSLPVEQFFFILVSILLLLAVADLIVGVSNDAVNFLVSAIGSRATSYHNIMLVASAGVIIGVTLSSGMMEVARQGVFRPAMYSFQEIMIVFAAVMLVDVLLLDAFNTLGLPTSTTVSVVFELLGAAVLMALLKHREDEPLANYINTHQAFDIVMSIVLSIILAFSLGAFAQFASRLIITYRERRYHKIFVSIWAAMALTAISYFIVLKVASGSSFLDARQSEWISRHALLLSAVAGLVWLLVVALLQQVHWNPLKFVVLFGTFAMSMAFASNDLVNFIGVPLAGLQSWQLFHASGSTQPQIYSMQQLASSVHIPTLHLIIAGLVMVLTLWMSSKARTVTATSVNLSHQASEGVERFGSTWLSRTIVGFTLRVLALLRHLIPARLEIWIAKRLQKPDITVATGQQAAFDLVRATVNLTVATGLIAIGTSHKLPLSTTFVIFMAAMGSSLADGAWGRANAVYRITGVLWVMSGWFVTALLAFVASAMVAWLLSSFGLNLVFPLLLADVLLMWWMRRHHERRRKQNQPDEEVASPDILNKNTDVVRHCTFTVQEILGQQQYVLQQVVDGLTLGERSSLREARRVAHVIYSTGREMKNKPEAVLKALEEKDIHTGSFYLQVLDYIHDLGYTMDSLAQACYNHVINHHQLPDENQLFKLGELAQSFSLYTNLAAQILEESNYRSLARLEHRQFEILQTIRMARMQHFAEIKRQQTDRKTAFLYLHILTEANNALITTGNMLRAQADFMTLPRLKARQAMN